MEFNLSQHFDVSTLLAAGGISAESYGFAGFLTNSIFVAAVVTVGILLFMRMATKQMSLVPNGKQNLVEFVVEFLYNQVEGIVGKKVAPKVFPLLATIFIFTLCANWFGLIPGVGTMGFVDPERKSEFMAGPLTIDTEAVEKAAHGDSHGDGDEAHPKDPAPEGAGETAIEGEAHAKGDGHDHVAPFTPLLRPATADLNMTLGMAVVFMIIWTWITIKEVGVWGFLKHTFGPKGGLTGVLKTVLVPIFLFVGIIEIISIMFRPVSLSFRLLGNVYAGETLLATMGGLGAVLGVQNDFLNFILRILLPLPFYFLEILVGLLQAIVFALLCTVYVQLSTSHEEEH